MTSRAWKKVKLKGFNHLYRRGKTGVLVVRMEPVGKKPLFKSLRSIDLTEDIKRKYKDIVEEYLGKKKSYEFKSRIIEDHVKNYLELKKAHVSERTLQSMMAQFNNHLLPYFGAMLPSDITEVTWEEYAKRAKTLTPGRKLFNDRKYFSMLFLYLQQSGVVQRKPNFKNFDPDRKKPKIPSDEQFEELLTATDFLLKSDSLKWRVRLLLLGESGMRVEETLELRKEHFDFKEWGISVPAEITKTGKERFVPIGPRLKEIIKDYFIHTDSLFEKGTEWVFPNRDGKGHEVEYKSGWKMLQKLTGHRFPIRNLRHYFCSNWAKAGKPIAVGAAIVGNSVEVFGRYYVQIDKGAILTEYHK